MGGISGAFLTGDLFNLYVWFEVMLMASFALLVMGKTRAQLDGGVKYVVINLISTLLFLTGLGLVYGMTGTLNMAHLHVKLKLVSDPGLVAAVAVLFLTAFGIKSGLFPLFFWLPASYHTPPVATSAIFAGLLTKVGVYALIRTFTLIFPFEDNGLRELVLVAAAATMIVGVLGAATRYHIRRILSFHIISQVGYMILGLGLFTPLALAGAVFYLLHHIIVKANLFLISGSDSPLRRFIRALTDRGAVPQPRMDRPAVFHSRLFTGGVPAAVRILGQNDPDPGQPGNRALPPGRRGRCGRLADGVLHG